MLLSPGSNDKDSNTFAADTSQYILPESAIRRNFFAALTPNDGNAKLNLRI